MVGPADRGPVPGFPLPFTPTNGFVVPLDPALVLVTSFADFTRQFGNPLPLPSPGDAEDYGYLAYAVRAFFANGGKRAYIARIVHFTTPPDEASATRSSVRLGQGVVLQLLRPAQMGQSELALTSLRGLNVGDTLSFRRRSDGTDLLSGNAGAAVITGTLAEPFTLDANDQFGVSVNGGAAVNMTPVNASSASVSTGAGPFNLNGGEGLQIRVGPASAPLQTVTFQATDFATPGAATAAEVAAVLNADLTGVQVVVAGGLVTIRSDQQGSGARIEVVGGTAQGLLALAIGPAGGGGNVADLEHVTIGEIGALFAPVGFQISGDGAGHLVITSVGVGATTTIQVVDTAVGTAARLGLSTAVATGTDPVSPAVPTVSSYDTRRNTVTLNAPLATDLNDPSEVYILRAGTVPGGDGPMFFARNPGKWSEDVSITINNSDRSPIPITAAALSTATAIQVQSTRSFYVGAIVEIDHGTTRSYHEVQGIVGTSLQLGDALGQPVTTSSFARVMEIDVIVDDTSGASPTEAYKGVSWNQGTFANMDRHYATQINAQSMLVYVQPPGVGTPALVPPGAEDASLATQPTTHDGFAQLMTTVGNDGLPAAGPAGDPDYVGNDPGPGQRTGIEALKDSDAISIIAAPGKTTPTVMAALIDQCELLRYRFAVLDGEAEPLGGSVTSIQAHRSIFDSSYAAYYTPWVSVTIGNQVTNGTQTVYLPPSGYVTGIYARTDNDRGVWKAPANEVVLNVTGLRFYFTTGEQDILNPVGINCIRLLETTGIRVWGARTLSSDSSVKYVNVRRTLIYLEASIDRGTQWVVFEPNNPDTWDRLTDSVSAFLTTQWRDGALFGLKPEDSFFVRCDETTMTADDIQNGRLICEIGVAIVRPAEFVIFRIEQITGFANQ